VELLLAMAPTPDGSGGGGGLISTLIMFGAIFAIFYFMIIRPQQKRAKEREKLLSAIQKGDKVILTSGLYGTVAGLEEKTCLIDVGNNVKMKFDRSAVSSVIKE
jgi:preprotein translocase subunit YajC